MLRSFENFARGSPPTRARLALDALATITPDAIVTDMLMLVSRRMTGLPK